MENRKATFVTFRAYTVLYLVLLLNVALAGEDADSRPAVHMYVFASKTCAECEMVKPDVLKATAEELGLNLVAHHYNVEDPTESRRLVLMERRSADTGNPLPVVFIGDHVLGGKEEIEGRLWNLLRSLRDKGAPPLPVPTRQEADAAFRKKKGGDTVHLAFFEEPGCRECSRVQGQLKLLEGRYEVLELREFDSTDRQNQFLLEALCEQTDQPPEKRLLTPAVFVGEYGLIGEEITYDRLDEIIEKYADGGGTEPVWQVSEAQIEAARDRLWVRSRKLGLLAVIAGGLVDGVNPCAFATLVFFVCCLLGTPRSRVNVLAAGLGFTAGVFITYLLAGIGLTEVLLKIEALPIISAVLTWLIIAITLVFFVLSVRDFLAARAGKTEEMSLTLPHALRMRINRLISKRVKAPTIAGVAIGLGVIVSILEFVCTGQVYLPLIRFLTKLPLSRMRGYGLLVLYNLAFVLPLLIVLFAVYFGMRSEQLTRFMQRHIAASKLGLAIFFLAMAAMLLSMQLT